MKDEVYQTKFSRMDCETGKETNYYKCSSCGKWCKSNSYITTQFKGRGCCGSIRLCLCPHCFKSKLEPILSAIDAKENHNTKYVTDEETAYLETSIKEMFEVFEDE